MRPRSTALILLVLALALGATACGGDDGDNDAAGEPATTAAETATGTGTEDDGGGAGTKLELAADPSGALAYDKTSLEAQAGKVEIDFTNDSSIPHNVTIEGEDAATETITGGSDSLELDLPAGTYTYFCSVPGHRAGGMEGTLTVN
jgi:plastocyanin